MNIGIIASNYVRISERTAKGTEIFVYVYTHALERRLKEKYNGHTITTYAAGDADVGGKLVSVWPKASVEDNRLHPDNYKAFELALFSRAFQDQDNIDVYHVHVSNGEYVLPFVPFVRKPIIITLHGGIAPAYERHIFTLFKPFTHVHFVSISDNQRRQLPHLHYAKTVYHGINAYRLFRFSPTGGENIMWAGRAIKEKGLDHVLEVIRLSKHPASLYPILVPSQAEWFNHQLRSKQKLPSSIPVSIDYTTKRSLLVTAYQNARVFLFPLKWEEPFGMVSIESLSCGTPVVAYARGSLPEIVKDGVTGFLVNPSRSDKRGDYIIKKTGIDGLVEAVQRIYNLAPDDYQAMRKKCRDDVERRFTTEHMVDSYMRLYDKLTRHGH